MIGAIPRYPAHLVEVVQAAGGRHATIRPSLPEDMDLQRAFFRALSAQSRYRRFMTPVAGLPETLAERFASIDYRSHLALLALTFEGGVATIIGEARYVVDAGDPAACELAVAVADAWQGIGMARALLDRLERQAAACGIRRIFADTLITNSAMIGLAGRSGYAVAVNREDASLARLEKCLPASPVAARAA